MKIRRVGLITYQYPHLKTEQVFYRLLGKKYDYKIYALPFSPRPERKVLFAHRPDQTESVHPQLLAAQHSVPYVPCKNDADIDGGCDVYLIFSGVLLSAACVSSKKIINCHAGIIPVTRGLDAFKWAVYDHKPMGVTLHVIDETVDQGQVLATVPTDVYGSDTLQTLARRHYENEVDCLSRFDEFLQLSAGVSSAGTAGAPAGEPRRRMPADLEKELPDKFVTYKKKYAL